MTGIVAGREAAIDAPNINLGRQVRVLLPRDLRPTHHREANTLQYLQVLRSASNYGTGIHLEGLPMGSFVQGKGEF